jgi:polysaccharide deacetylase family protein (PEP-CTERM system associated)
MPFQTPRAPHLFTVDVEEYFQVVALESVVSRDQWLTYPSRVARSVDQLLESLSRYGRRGTFFTLGWLAQHRPDVVRAIAAAGHEIASHGFLHQRVTSLSPAAFREDVRRSKCALEDLTGNEVLGYRAPSFSIVPGHEWAFDVLIEEGYRYDSSLFPIRRPGYGYPSALTVPNVLTRPSGRIAEYPLATTRLLGYPIPAAGGGYLRQFPLRLIQRAFREAAARNESATFYIHPWEIDAGQPRLPVSRLNRIRHYRGLDTALGRIHRLLEEFPFDTIESHLPALLPRVLPTLPSTLLPTHEHPPAPRSAAGAA